ncbi:hypothetical protein ACWD04_22330 [Streptomyces sp. NPDC002911]
MLSRRAAQRGRFPGGGAPRWRGPTDDGEAVSLVDRVPPETGRLDIMVDAAGIMLVARLWKRLPTNGSTMSS